VLRLLDRLLYRRPFEGGSALRYARHERPAFGDLDDRLLDGLALAGTEWLLDLGCGPAAFAARARARYPGLGVIAIDPSKTYARFSTVRACGEALPLADRSVDIAICLSSIRHVRDRAATLRELRRVATRVTIVELDPAAEPHRIAAHADRIATPILRRAFGPLVCKTAPPAEAIVALADAAGFRTVSLRPDPIQPVYVLDLA
jgi:ubiquinone/menaquinone biosynthesis C-methylase UbiE